MFGTLEGSVERFDDPRGLGMIRSDDGRGFPFHCTSIANGTRTIGEGRRVSFEVVDGRLGEWEAVAIVER